MQEPPELHPAVRHLLRTGLVEGSILAVAPPGRHGLRRGLGAAVVTPSELDGVERSYRTVLDLCGFTGTVAERARHAERLAAVVEPAGFLHVLCPSDRAPPGARRPGVGPADLMSAFHQGWTLLTLQDSWVMGRAGRRHAWLATFVHGPVRRRRAAPAVRHFTDLGNFGSLDMGPATDRPPWGK